jgi:hypothetical protein
MYVMDPNANQLRETFSSMSGGSSSSSGGGGFFSNLGGLFGKFFGGSSGGGSSGFAGGVGDGDFSGDFSMASYASGTDYVPYDQVAKIHKGERIVPAAENADRGDGGGLNITFNVNTLDARTAASVLVQNKQLIVGIIHDAYRRGGRVSGMVT